MKVVHVLNTDRFSGAENVVCQIIAIMRQYKGIEMVYCSPDGPIREAVEAKGIKFVSVKKLSISEIKRITSEVKPDLIHAHDMKASCLAAMACKNIPLISHIHNNSYSSRGFSVKSMAYLIAGIKAKHVFWVSKSAKDGYMFRKMIRNKSSILYNIISIDDLKGRVEEDPNKYFYDVIFLGRLAYPKNPERLIRVLRMVAQRIPNIRIAIVGTGPLESDIAQLIEEYNLKSNIELLGFRNNPYRILHDSKVMLMTSRWEGLPMCALEAMALGVPIVSTPTDGLKELIESGMTGYLSDDDITLAEAICKVIGDERLHGKLAQNCVSKANYFNDTVKYASSLLQVYHQYMK